MDQLGIETNTVRHPPAFTVDDNKEMRGALQVGHCKSLCLKDKKGAMWPVVMLEDGRLDTNALQKTLGSARLSFGKPELTQEILGVTPGSVTPFSLINETSRDLTVILEARMLEHDQLNYHPLQNEATTTIATPDLLRFIEACGHTPVVMAF
ncbi:MAG: prolyl-tRNA synthetase associated domain-containing protein [Rhodospirillaceae bacterium]